VLNQDTSEEFGYALVVFFDRKKNFNVGGIAVSEKE